MTKPVVLIAEQLSPATIAALGPDFEVVNVDGTDRPALLSALASANALLVRSATKVDAEAIAAAPQLRIIARAGVGLDNVDTAAATAAGVLVVNAPTSNIISAAELAVGHLLSLARHIPAANASLKSGAWKRSSFTGTELFEKTIGIVGLGRIGALVAERLAGFGVKLIGYDPYVPVARAATLGVELKPLLDVMKESDFITIHIPKTPDTTGLIGDAEFAAAKPTLRIVNASRGGIIDEDALKRALESGAIAAAGLDVFVSEPPKDDALTSLPNTVVTPHLGASTDEAQEKAGVAVAQSVRLALSGEFVPDAVNVEGGAIDVYVRPGLPLVEKLGQLFTAIAGGPVAKVVVEVGGELADYNVDVFRLAALKGLLLRVTDAPVTYVNAPGIAEERGLQVELRTTPESPEYRNFIRLSGATESGRSITVAGTLTGPKQVQKITEVLGHEVEVPIEQYHVVLQYEDRPGIVAIYGREFGDAGVNIAGMQISRTTRGGDALSILTVDHEVPADVIDRVGEAIAATRVQQIVLD